MQTGSKPQILQTVVGPALLHRSSRRTLAISVLPDGSLELVAPLHASEASIAEKVAKRRKWILMQRKNFAAMNARRSGRRYISGATHRYLGRQYRLKVSRGQTNEVLLKGAFFHVNVVGAEPENVHKSLEKWFRQRAKEQFTRRVEAWRPWCAKHGLPEPVVRLLKMPKRWGSAGKDGRIALNPELIHAPSRCIDYVIAHEICHLMHPNHGPRFRTLLQQLCPDWKQLKSRLESI